MRFVINVVIIAAVFLSGRDAAMVTAGHLIAVPIHAIPAGIIFGTIAQFTVMAIPHGAMAITDHITIIIAPIIEPVMGIIALIIAIMAIVVVTAITTGAIIADTPGCFVSSTSTITGPIRPRCLRRSGWHKLCNILWIRSMT
jgi:hypothetical protein